ncbi:MAG TPA: hypothetical protein VNY84_11465, partial [Acidimicrobiales bacterium]|nr:hypothetical protein [Acidimicrobiales bacterium]
MQHFRHRPGEVVGAVLFFVALLTTVLAGQFETRPTAASGASSPSVAYDACIPVTTTTAPTTSTA